MATIQKSNFNVCLNNLECSVRFESAACEYVKTIPDICAMYANVLGDIKSQLFRIARD
jgi:hypothetical protein